MAARRKSWLAAGVALAAVGVAVAWPTIRAAAFLLDFAGRGGVVRALIPIRPRATAAEDLDVPTRHGPIPARLYRSSPASPRVVLVFPGIHAGGVDEPRLAAFSARLAASGYTVLSAPLPELREFRVTGRSTDAIEDVAVWAAARREIAPTGRVALVGVSFSGGLALVAAGRPSLAGRVSLVLSLGGQGDLARALHYLCTGRLPDGSTRTPHEYGLAIIAIDAADRIVPPDQTAGLVAAIRAFLDASSEDETPAEAAGLTSAALAHANAMPEPSRSILTWIVDRNVEPLGRLLDPLVDDLARDPALSPERSPVTSAPVFLIHGRDDNVIPSSETPLLARDLAARGNHDVHWILTPAVSHAGMATDVPLIDAWRLTRFWQQMMSALD